MLYCLIVHLFLDPVKSCLSSVKSDIYALITGCDAILLFIWLYIFQLTL